MTDRVILHCDLNNFYASVELLTKPELKDKPVAVCGSVERRHGIVLAKNYVAKRFGIKTAQTVWQAEKLCPDLVIMDAHYEKYKMYSHKVREILYEFTDIVEPFGPDESWLDVSGSVRLFGSGEEIAYKIKDKIKAETGLTVSVGVSFNKVFAKLGSDYKKPDAVTVISKENFKDMIFGLPADSMIGVGRHTYSKLQRIGITTLGELAASDRRTLKSELGVMGEKLWYYANGLDMSPVISQNDLPDVKSISRSTTNKADLFNNEDVWKTFIGLSEDISRQLEANDFYALKLTVMVRDESLSWESYTKTLDNPIHLSIDIAREAMAVFNAHYDWRSSVHSIGIAVSELISSSEPVQISFYSSDTAENNFLEKECESIRERFGKNAIQKASLIDFNVNINEQKNFGR